MKLTKNALGMLLNKYRKILEKCCFLNVFGGIACAAMIIANPVYADTDWNSDPVIINESSTLTTSQNGIHAKDNVFIQNDGNLTVAIQSTKDNAGYLQVNSTLVLTGGEININKSKGIQGGEVTDILGTPYTGTFTMNNGTVNIKGGELRMAAININGGEINLSEGMYADQPANWNDNAKIVATNSGSFNINNAAISLGNYSFMAGGRVNLQDSSVTLGGDGPESAAMIRVMSQRANNLNILNSNIDIPQGKYGVISSPNVNALESKINVAGNLDFAGGLPSTGQGTLDQDLANIKSYGTANINKGSQIDISSTGKITVHDGFSLIAGEGSAITNQGALAALPGSETDLQKGNFSSAGGSRLIVEGRHIGDDAQNPANEYRGHIRLTDSQFQDVLKEDGGIAINGGYLHVNGDAVLDMNRMGGEEAENGKISFANSDVPGVLNFSNVKIDGSEISIPGNGHINVDKYMTVDQNVTQNNGFVLVGFTNAPGGLKAGDGNGTYNIENSTLQAGFRYDGRFAGTSEIIDIDANMEISNKGGNTSWGNFYMNGGADRDTQVHLNKNVYLDRGFLSMDQTETTLSAGSSPAEKNSITLDGTSSFLLTGYRKGILNINEQNTIFAAHTNNSLVNSGIINANAETLGLAVSGNGWTSANLGKSFTGKGRFNLAGIKDAANGNEISKESFHNLKLLLGGGILRTDAQISNAVSNGRVERGEVEAGGILAGADLGNAIATGNGGDGVNTTVQGAFGGIDLTGANAKGITLTSGTALELDGNNQAVNLNGNLVNTPAGAGDVALQPGAYGRFANGKVNDIQINGASTYLELEDVSAGALTFNDGAATSSTGSCGSYNVYTNGAVSADSITTSDGTGRIVVGKASTLTVSGNIGEADKQIYGVDVRGTLQSESINTKYLDVLTGTLGVTDAIYAQTINLVNAKVNSGNSIVMDEISITAGSGLVSRNGSITGNSLDIDDGALQAKENININGNASLNKATVSADGKVEVTGSTTFSGDSKITSAQNINLNNVYASNGTNELASANGNIIAINVIQSSGSEIRMKAVNGLINVSGADVSEISARSLQATGDVTLSSGAMTLTGNNNQESKISGTLSLNSSETNVRDITIEKELFVDGGSFQSSGSVTINDNAWLMNDAQATLNKLVMTENQRIAIGTPEGRGATLQVSSLQLNGGDLLVDPAWGNAPSNVAVRGFDQQPGSTDNIINGNVVVGQNSYAAFGTDNLQWLPGIVTGPMGLRGLRQNGVTAALGIFSPIALGPNHSLTVDGSWVDGNPYDRDNSKITFANNSLLVVNGKPEEGSISYTGDTRPADVKAAISAEKATLATVASGAKLYITGAEKDKSYVVLDPDKIQVTYENDTTAWKGANLGTDNPLVRLTRSDDGIMRAYALSAAVALPGLDSELAAIVDNAMQSDKIGVDERFFNTGTRGRQFLSRALALASPLYGNNPEEAAKTIEGAARMYALGGVPQMTMAANNAAGAAITQRTGIADPGAGIQGIDERGNPVADKVNGHGFAIWLMPLFQSTNGFGMAAGNYDYDFSGSLGGIALGADYKLSHKQMNNNVAKSMDIF